MENEGSKWQFALGRWGGDISQGFLHLTYINTSTQQGLDKALYFVNGQAS